MNKQWCFHVRNATTGEKLIGGTMTAPTMEDAAKDVVRLNNITYERTEHKYSVDHKHLYKGKEVNVHITAHPEYLKS